MSSMNENPVTMPMCPLRMKFLTETQDMKCQSLKRTHLVVAVKLPTGATELIINTENIESKAEYYRNAYDDTFCLKTNPQIQIVGYMLV
jgi:hypothetical protein